MEIIQLNKKLVAIFLYGIFIFIFTILNRTSFDKFNDTEI